ncbi:peroxin 13 [Actinidia rufa]|uniref:Peroxin-13 n=1 Tax=Actinidia rufa TaxID=165716 RepID=A0A7J0FLK0_9ERIC|nr:peroxin 13 [Actinidia rufa]
MMLLQSIYLYLLPLKSDFAVNSPPPKPWEQAGSSSGPTPFKPSSPGSTSDVVETSGTARPGEIVSTADRNTTINRNTLGRPVPTRPWEQQTYGSTYGGYGSGLNYNSGYGSGMYGSSYGGLGGSYGGGMYGNNMYRGGYGGLYGGGSGMYGGGMYNSGLGGPMGGYGMGVGGPYGNQDPNDPNNPFGAPPSPPGFWISFLRVMEGVVTFFGRIAILIDQNTQAFHMFISALLQLFDRSGLLYGELARFALRLLGIRTKPKQVQPPGPHNPRGGQNFIEGPKVAPSGAWDGVWGDSAGT